MTGRSPLAEETAVSVKQRSGIVLAIETSCDETAVAIFDTESGLRASVLASQARIHEQYGGVVPEVASRNHLTEIDRLLEAALAEAGLGMSEIDLFAATTGPGLATSLMIGASVAKGLALGLGRPYLAVNHLEGHLLSPFFSRPEGAQPSMALVVSGGHTLLVDVRNVGDYELIGQTRDDAAGEAFDKVAKLLGLPYPGGPHIGRLAEQGNPRRFDFPRSMLHSGDFHFSFSGLKTSVRYLLPELTEGDLADVCASFQEAVVEVLVSKTLNAARAYGRRCVAVSGGVSCNDRLRAAFTEACGKRGIELLLAGSGLCTDNAAMIAYVAASRWQRGETSGFEVDIDPNLRVLDRRGH